MRAKEFINLDIKNEGVLGGAALGGLVGGLAAGVPGAAIGAGMGAFIASKLKEIDKLERDLQNLTATNNSLNVEKELLIWKSRHNEIIQKNKEIMDMILKIPNVQIRQKYLDKSQALIDAWAEKDFEDDDDFNFATDNENWDDETAWEVNHDLKYLEALSQLLLEIKQILGVK
jgi:hypothetical protein